MSVDGGNIRIRTPEGQPCSWKGYKALRLHKQQAVAASFEENAVVIDWVNRQPLRGAHLSRGTGTMGFETLSTS